MVWAMPFAFAEDVIIFKCVRTMNIKFPPGSRLKFMYLILRSIGDMFHLHYSYISLVSSIVVSPSGENVTFFQANQFLRKKRRVRIITFPRAPVLSQQISYGLSYHIETNDEPF